jgi:hypothetical protein
MRRAVVLFVVAAFAIAPSSPALARGDGWEPLPAQAFVLPDEVCGFPVEVSFPVNQEYAKTVSQDDVTTVLRITGRLVERLTDLDTGASIDVQVSGPLTLTLHADTGMFDVDGQGNSAVLFLQQDQEQFGVPGIALVSGHVIETVDGATNDVISLSIRGHVDDACSRLG